MSGVVVVDREQRLELPDEAREWFPPGARFSIERQGDRVVLQPLAGLAAHLAAASAAGSDDAATLDEIDSEIQAVRREEANL